MATLKEQVEEITKLKHRLAVWEAIHYLVDEKFISKDGRKASAVRVPNCAVEIVPEEMVESVLQAIGDGPIAELQEQINTIENQEVVVIGEAKAKA
jgi:hypothetical protein